MDASAETPRDAVWLGRLCLLLATALLAGWAGSRMKPVLLFGPVFGLVLGVIAVVLHGWFPVRSNRAAGVEVAICAMLGVAGSFWISAERAHAAFVQDGNQGVAEALIQTLRQMPADAATAPATPTEAVSGTAASRAQRMDNWLARRYPAAWADGFWWAAGLELLLAGLAAGIVSRFRWREAPPPEQQEPAA